MNQKIMKHFVLGAITAYGLAVIVLFSSAKLGILRVQADVAPSWLEASLLGSALHASVARHAPMGGNLWSPLYCLATRDPELASSLDTQMCGS
jgi:hypothetical protein